MKKCTCCGEFKPESEFHWRNKLLGKRRGYCKKCQAEKHRKWYENEDNAKVVKERTKERNARLRDESRRYVYDYLCNHPCEICGESNPAALDFHHRNPRKKVKEIPKMISGGYSLKSIQSEIDKCRVLCSNCHRKKTAKDQGWYEW
jgi:5-methylcytosine-specific restriction endonuclease McrA